MDDLLALVEIVADLEGVENDTLDVHRHLVHFEHFEGLAGHLLLVQFFIGWGVEVVSFLFFR